LSRLHWPPASAASTQSPGYSADLNTVASAASRTPAPQANAVVPGTLAPPSRAVSAAGPGARVCLSVIDLREPAAVVAVVGTGWERLGS